MGNFFCLYQSFRRRRFYRTCSKSNLSLAFYGSLIFALQRANAFAPRLLAISLSTDRSSLLCKEPSITLRYLRLSRSLLCILCQALPQFIT
ncbi:hypothetical protein BWD14_03700 [Leptospira santarosai]|uniref:Lipoprotein n=1 Tax=Leptospira santarosai TaxID=28183 RepID=A0AB73LPH2_9LEPT|nr:hypothetical protein BWD14_03700 [Leptospira santarosai]